MYWLGIIWKEWDEERRLVEFLEKYVFGKYKNHLIILDNAGSHRNNYVKDAIIENKNNYLFSVPYTSKTNVVEMFFNQIKYYLKLNKKVLKYEDLNKNVRKAINKVKKENYKKYFFICL